MNLYYKHSPGLDFSLYCFVDEFLLMVDGNVLFCFVHVQIWTILSNRVSAQSENAWQIFVTRVDFIKTVVPILETLMN